MPGDSDEREQLEARRPYRIGRLTGPFAASSHGVTVTRSSGRIEWRLADVQAEKEAVFEIPLPDAVVQFRWRFEDLGGQTRMTQRVSIAGEQSSSLVSVMASSLEAASLLACKNSATPWQMPQQRHLEDKRGRESALRLESRYARGRSRFS